MGRTMGDRLRGKQWVGLMRIVRAITQGRYLMEETCEINLILD